MTGQSPSYHRAKEMFMMLRPAVYAAVTFLCVGSVVWLLAVYGSYGHFLDNSTWVQLRIAFIPALIIAFVVFLVSLLDEHNKS